jgi:hypothetical protein
VDNHLKRPFVYPLPVQPKPKALIAEWLRPDRDSKAALKVWQADSSDALAAAYPVEMQ